MPIKIFWNYICGYVKISVEGYFVERFINICRNKNILLWNIKSKKSTYLYANISPKDFRKLKEIAQKTKCRIKIESKNGLPFILHRYQKRKIFVIFLLLIISTIFILSNFIWNIEIIGNNNISKQEIISTLEENNLKIGTLKPSLQTKNIINNVRLKRDDIAWMGIKLIGTNAIVEIVETEPKPEIINEEDYCNIISDKMGVITKINAANGTALVQPGDIVKPGDILVGGWMEGKYTGTRYVHSNGEIQARVWYSKKEKMELIQEQNIQTGEEEKKYKICINNFAINLSKRLPKFENYDTINENKKLKIFSNFYLPIELQTTIYKETQKEKIEYTNKQAKQILIAKLEEELGNEIEKKENIVNKQINYTEEATYIEVEVIYEVLENIGTKEKILF